MSTSPYNTENEARQLLRHGAMLIFLGLLSGFTTMVVPAPRAALGAHTVGLIEGGILIALAGAWYLIRASVKIKNVIKYTLLIGFYSNWLGAQLAGFWSAGRNMMPAHGKDMPVISSQWQDITVSVLFGISIIVIASAVLILWKTDKKEE